MKTAYAAIKGFEIMRMFTKGRFELWKYGQGIKSEIRIITDNLLFFLKIYTILRIIYTMCLFATVPYRLYLRKSFILIFCI